MNYEEKYKKALDRAVNLFVTNNISVKAACEIFPELNESEEINYEKKYKKALEWMRSVYDGLHGATKEDAEHYFPELKESKDEKIKREIVAYINELADLKNEKIPTKWLDWLEKQEENKPTDKVEPMFHEGEWITNGNYTWKIVEVKSLDYILQSQDGNIVDDNISYVDKQFNLWTINDAKDGDLIYVSTGIKGIQAIFHKFENGIIYFHCNLCSDFTQGGYEPSGDVEFVSPLQKTHYQKFFQKMKEAGYKWDAEKKELKKTEMASKENEDEGIRKAIHIYLAWLDGRKDYAPKGIYSIKDMITWLEKQKGD